MGPLTLAGLLYLGAAVGVLPFALRSRPSAGSIDRKNLLRLGGAVLFGGILGPVLLLSGLSLAPASSVVLWLSMETPATVLLGVAFFHEHADRRVWFAAALVVTASVMLASPSGFGTAGAAVLVLLACGCWGLDNNFTALIDEVDDDERSLALQLAIHNKHSGPVAQSRDIRKRIPASARGRFIFILNPDGPTHCRIIHQNGISAPRDQRLHRALRSVAASS